MFAENGNNPSLLPVAGAQPPFVSVLLVTCAVLLLAGVAYAGWDYRRVSQIYRATELRAPEYRENTLEKIRGSWLFRNQVRFAEFSITNLTLDNAEQVYALGRDLLHFSPEARVVEKLVESAVMLGRDDEAQYYVARYEAAFPAQHAQWHKSKALPPGLPQFRQP